MDGIALLTIFILSVFVGFEVVSKVSTVLHTPLMSGANAIHGVVVMGAIIVAGKSEPNSLALWISLVAVLLGAINLVGGFVVGLVVALRRDEKKVTAPVPLSLTSSF